MATIRLSFPGGSAEGHRSLYAAFLLTLTVCTSCSRRESISAAEKTRADALAQAKLENKQVLLIFVQPGTIWSDQLDKFHADPGVHRVLSRHFVLARINIESPGGMELHFEHAPRNMPALAIRDSDGAYLADSGNGEENFGFPNNDEQVDRYITMLKTACPNVSDEDVIVLREKLQSLRSQPDAEPPSPH